MMEPIIVAGTVKFNEEVKQRLSHYSINWLTDLPNYASQFEPSQVQQEKKSFQSASVVFVDSQPEWMPIAELALKESKDLVLFGVETCSTSYLAYLLKLAIESKSIIVNGDSLLFNPVVYPMRNYFAQTEITSLTSNHYRKYLSRKSIFNCIELLLYTNKSPLRNCSAKGIKLSGSRLNVLHIRLEFENNALAVFEMTNSKPNSKLYIESAGNGNWMSLDLLSFNGQYYHYSDNEHDEVKPPKQIYPTERNSMTHMLHFIQQEVMPSVNKHQQFENVIQTSKAISQIEEQLRRGLPNFVRFEDE